MDEQSSVSIASAAVNLSDEVWNKKEQGWADKPITALPWVKRCYKSSLTVFTPRAIPSILSSPYFVSGTYISKKTLTKEKLQSFELQKRP